MALLMALALTAAADAKRKFDSPPGGDDIALVAGAPTVAYAAADGVHVVRATKAGHRWRQLGGTIRHAAGQSVFDVNLSVDPEGQPWVAWTETDATGTRQARVAAFDGVRWHEVVGGDRPINQDLSDPNWYPFVFHALRPQIVFFQGRPWVFYVQDNPEEFVIGVRRLSADGSHWDVLSDPWLGRPGATRAVVASGQLYLATDDVIGFGMEAWRYDPSAPHFGQLLYAGIGDEEWSFTDLSVLGGRPEALVLSPNGLTVKVLSSDRWGQVGSPLAHLAYTRNFVADLEGSFVTWIHDGVHVARLMNGDWRQLKVPGSDGATLTRLASGRGGTWLLWRDSSGAHVVRIA
jgi:hypothetical protein